LDERGLVQVPHAVVLRQPLEGAAAYQGDPRAADICAAQISASKQNQQSNPTSSLSYSLSRLRKEIDNYQKTHPTLELFAHFSRQCNDNNLHKGDFIQVTASSTLRDFSFDDWYNENEEWTVLGWTSEPYKHKEWLQFDLKKHSFKIETIRFNVFGGQIPRHWQLLGSNDDRKWFKNWIMIHDQGNDYRCIPDEDFVVDYDIENRGFFKRFKFQQLDNTYSGYPFLAFRSIEFVGRLISN
jgi:hypothetical protein